MNLSENLDATNPTAALADHIRAWVDERWQTVLEEHRADLEREFATRSDVSYRTYGGLLLGPLRADLEELASHGYTFEPAYPGAFRDSVEPAAPPAERVRTFWTVVSRGGEPVGTLVFRMHHDHARFRVPRAPEVLALEETAPDAVRTAVAALTR